MNFLSMPSKAMKNMKHFLLCVLIISPPFVICIPPPSVHCASGNEDCTVNGAYGTWPDRTTCKAAQVVYPSSEQDILQAVAYGAKNNMKMKVVTRLSHSFPKLVCPGGSHGLVISTRDYNKNILVNSTSMTVTVDGGVELHQLLSTLAEFEFAFPHSPYWNGVTLGGLLSTGSHGSSLTGAGSAVHEYVVGMNVVVPASEEEGYAKVVSLTEKDEDLNAAKVSLGVLGVISKITLKVQPMFKRSLTNTIKSDGDLEQLVGTFANGNEFGDITWHPSLEKAVYRVDIRVPTTIDGDGVNEFLGFQPAPTYMMESLRTTEDLLEATSNTTGICIRAEAQALTSYTLGYGFKNSDVSFTGYPVIGDQNKIQTSGSCYSSSTSLLPCPWDPSIRGVFCYQTAISISLEKVKDFISDVKKLRSLVPDGVCGPDGYNGFLMRYVRSSSAYLGKPEDSVDFYISYYRARSATTPRLHEDILEEIEQMAVFKYQGVPHWGKNRNVAFVNAASKYPRLTKFLDVKKRMDPNGLFSSEWSDAVLGVGRSDVTIDSDFCALEGLCICSEDRHCAPLQGYYCRPGKVFKQARVCEKTLEYIHGQCIA